MICLAILNPTLRSSMDSSMPKVIQDLQVLVAQVETGALVRFEDSNFALLDAATRTIQNLLSRVITGRLPQGQAIESLQDPTQDMSIDGDGLWNTWNNHELQDFEADFWTNLSEHPLLLDIDTHAGDAEQS